MRIKNVLTTIGKVLKLPKPSARANLRIFIGRTIDRGGMMASTVDTEVTVLSESPDSFTVKYPRWFTRKHPELCESDVIRKNDFRRELTYSRFLAANQSPPLELRVATLRQRVRVKRSNGSNFAALDTEVYIAEETQTHYRLRFTESFAQKRPYFCREWISRSDRAYRLIFR
jgi:hypothetical protein